MSSSFYLPILKWKDGEIKALKELSLNAKLKVIPLVEFVKKESRKILENKRFEYTPIPDEAVLSAGLSLIRNDFTDMTMLVDTVMLTDVERKEAISRIYDKVKLFEDGIILPVIYLSELEGFLNSKLKEPLETKGFALRVKANELDKLSNFELSQERKSKVHLVFDFGVTDENVETIIPFLKNPRCTNGWKSISVVSGACPKDLNEFDASEVGNCKREDWMLWKKIASEVEEWVSINYGDYTVRYPIYENIHNPNTSFSLRYTLNESWLIFRGYSKKSKYYKGFVQYRAHAVSLVEDEQYGFSGEEFSQGDAYIKSKAKLFDDTTQELLTTNCGSSSTWIQATINHHVYKVLDQLSLISMHNKTPNVVFNDWNIKV